MQDKGSRCTISLKSRKGDVVCTLETAQCAHSLKVLVIVSEVRQVTKVPEGAEASEILNLEFVVGCPTRVR